MSGSHIEPYYLYSALLLTRAQVMHYIWNTVSFWDASICVHSAYVAWLREADFGESSLTSLIYLWCSAQHLNSTLLGAVESRAERSVFMASYYRAAVPLSVWTLPVLSLDTNRDTCC